nr:MAG TPA: hypothetical protein [Caudoviricetes sp.]
MTNVTKKKRFVTLLSHQKSPKKPEIAWFFSLCDKVTLFLLFFYI